MKIFLLTACGLLCGGPLLAQRTDGPSLLSEVKKAYAPDARTAIFEVQLTADGTLRGRTDRPAAKTALLERLRAAGLAVTDSLQLLPDAGLGADTAAIVRVSVCNIRTRPDHAAELATQALMGTPVRVLERRSGWARIQTPDRYIGYVDGGAIVPDSAAGRPARRLMITAPAAYGRRDAAASAPPVTDLVAGNVVGLQGEKAGHYAVQLPDGRRAFVPKTQAMPYEKWVASRQPTGPNLVATAHGLTGLPYLWGGTSMKGVDCSGFTKTVYFLNGVVLPRDASQQVNSGLLVDETSDWARLEPGDLLFFGRKGPDGSERVTHVGMWIGDGQFIHASSFVQVASVRPDSPLYDAFNTGRYLRARRILGHYENAWPLETDRPVSKKNK